MFDLSRPVLEQHSLDMRQFIDAQQATLSNGMRIIHIHNSSGLTFSILPDRGFDIWTAHYHGIPLTWISQGSPHPPEFATPWMRQFNGGLLTTCGLRHVGPPETDSITGENRDIHGLYSRLRALNLSTHARWESNHYILEVSGQVAESRLFGEQLLLQRAYRLVLGEPTIEIVDTVSNLADTPSPFMLLYHFNVGYPLVRQGSRLYLPVQATRPRDEAAQAGFDTWDTYGEATAGYAEQVFYHVLKQRDGWANTILSNEDIALELSWDTRHAPFFTQWKNTRQGIYVSGIEPGNCIPEGQNAARESGRLVMLQPGEQHTFTCRLRLLSGKGTIQERIKAIHT